MPRYQSRLFNWIDQSLPAKLGRRARQLLDQQLQKIPSFNELPRLLVYQVAKAALYPVYLIASTAKRTFPALDRQKNTPKQELRSQSDVRGLLNETEEILPNNLRPLTRFLNWIDRTKLQLDRKIAAIVKRPSQNMTAPTAMEQKLLANQIFAEIWQQEIEQRQANQNALKENNGLAENVALGKNRSLEQLRRLIEAAIAYFFGNPEAKNAKFRTELPNDQANELNGKSDEIAGLEGTENNISQALPDSPKLRRKRISANQDSGKSGTQNSVKAFSALKENAPLSTRERLEQLRELIAAAIDYFIGKKAIAGDGEINDGINDGMKGGINQASSDRQINQKQSAANLRGNRPKSFFGEAAEPLKNSPQDSVSNQDQDRANSLKIDDQLERLQRLIEAAIAYFFGKQLNKPTLDETSDLTPSEGAWLTMEDVFGDDNGPWPLPLEYESVAFSKSPDMAAINSSGELQNFETTTSQLSQERLDGGMILEEEELLAYSSSFTDSESDRPLRAWIEANAALLGYVYNPVMVVVFWLDGIILKIENFFISLWQGFINFPKQLINSIRYGNRKHR
ncbi:hypothetical protein H6F42_01705 [Pseudanabaena sp. FACHB-1998]|uniref:hypothetical protein n=1 Tax=Pseudanabaena sp. FACHB-1998 TaxID=2692858 RepID=UPI0016816C71|nr:hypothetical protein [Pseudanabaena sp. FACHB-1998]MBD2175633.1 hypothetical protein [Pseudanabaena sp. FACHB-1998]